MSREDQLRAHVLSIYEAALAAVEPGAAVDRAWPAAMKDTGNRSLVAIGKASLAMAHAACAQTRLNRGLVLCPPELAEAGSDAPLPDPIEVLPVDHPIPSDRNAAAAGRVRDLASNLTEQDTLLLLISGGGSAHLTLPAPGLTIDDLRALTEALLAAGEPIERINTVRKHCEQLKGGRLAALTTGARTIALVISDVVGDPLESIASGPAAPDPTTFGDALTVIQSAGLAETLPRITDHLQRGLRGEIPETPGPGDPAFDRVEHQIIASNRVAVDAAAARAQSLRFDTRILDEPVMGEARQQGRRLAAIALDATNDRLERPLAILAGGETSVTLGPDHGLGGRNQELALAAVQAIRGEGRIAIGALSTDGVDGPTDAAGAIVTGGTWEAIRAAGLDPSAALDRHDAHPALDAADAIVRTGPTGTNVSDLVIMLIEPP